MLSSPRLARLSFVYSSFSCVTCGIFFPRLRVVGSRMGSQFRYIGGMTDSSTVPTYEAIAEVSEQRHIIGLLMASQLAQHRGEHATATAILTDLVVRFGRETIDAALWVQAAERVDTEAHLTRLFGRYKGQHRATKSASRRASFECR